jgi:hypothetical protein
MLDELLRAAIAVRLGTLSDRLFTRAALENLCSMLVDIMGVGVSVSEVTARSGHGGTVRLRVAATDEVARLLERVFGELVPVGVAFEVHGEEAEREALVFGAGMSGAIGRIGRHVPGMHEIAQRLLPATRSSNTEAFEGLVATTTPKRRSTKKATTPPPLPVERSTRWDVIAERLDAE